MWELFGGPLIVEAEGVPEGEVYSDDIEAREVMMDRLEEMDGLWEAWDHKKEARIQIWIDRRDGSMRWRIGRPAA